VIRAMTRWPNVPAVYGWLSLDARGGWRVRGEPILHRGVIEFINRNYAANEAGQWFFQNGPQRAFVDLDYTPWVYGLDGRGAFSAHTGAAVADVHGAWLDEEGSLLVLTTLGIGVVCDRDLGVVSQWLELPGGGGCDEEAVAALLAGEARERIDLVWRDRRIEVGVLRRERVAARFGFDPQPRAPDEDGA